MTRKSRIEQPITELLTPMQVAEELKITEAEVHKLMALGSLPVVTVNDRLRVARTALGVFITEQSNAPSSNFRLLLG